MKPGDFGHGGIEASEKVSNDRDLVEELALSTRLDVCTTLGRLDRRDRHIPQFGRFALRVWVL